MPITISKGFSGGSFGLTSKEIIREGLVLYYNPSFPASYPGSGTSLFDLSGNGNTSTLTNGPVVSSTDNIRFVSFDGIDDYARVTTTPTVLQGNLEFTVCGWFNRRANILNKIVWGIGTGTTAQGINTYNTSTNIISMDLWGTTTISTSVTYPLNEWVFCAWQKRRGVFSRANITIWRNLVSYTDTALTVSGVETTVPAINTSGVFIGNGATTTGFASQIDVSNFMIYSRLLGSAEITRTYNATKTYVGL
jgi:hypothetical protein